MKSWIHLVALAVLVFAGSAATAAPGAVLDWSQLPDPSAQVFKDPYRDLSPEQFDDVIFFVRTRAKLEQGSGTTEEQQTWQEMLAETEEALTADGIDLDWLLSQRQVVTERRKNAATAGNPQFDGQAVTVAGFAIPAPADADGTPVAYLVPERGMCSHMPPPPPNQMIRVRLTDDWTPSFVHEPVRLTGVLTIEPSEQQMIVVDGVVPMHATFQMDVIGVETLEDQGKGLEWGQNLKDRIRAAGDGETNNAAVSE
ncbi:MAG: DUF3299 domain-containing protein [Ruegeria sp.]